MNNNSNLPSHSNPPRKPELEYTLKRKRSPVPFLATAGFLGLYAALTAFAA